MTTEELTAQTTFYALTAPLPGYTLEDQVLGSLTLREWLKKYSNEDAEYDLVDWILGTYGFYTEETDAIAELAFIADEKYWSEGRVEPFTPASLLARLREMGEEANEL